VPARVVHDERPVLHCHRTALSLQSPRVSNGAARHAIPVAPTVARFPPSLRSADRSRGARSRCLRSEALRYGARPLAHAAGLVGEKRADCYKMPSNDWGYVHWDLLSRRLTRSTSPRLVVSAAFVVAVSLVVLVLVAVPASV